MAFPSINIKVAMLIALFTTGFVLGLMTGLAGTITFIFWKFTKA